jgi:signal transduction histidine kinase
MPPFHEKTCLERVDWLIQLRWIACLMVFAVITSTIYLFHLPLLPVPLYFGNAILVLYNGLLRIWMNGIKRREPGKERLRRATQLANLQISIDLLMLSYFIHYSGGLENPFIFYFIFHMVIASILLSRKAAYLQASFAIILLSLIGLAELTFLPHYHLSGFLSHQSCNLSAFFTAGVLSIIGSTLYLTVFMATSIEQRLRLREVELAKANERLAEQDRLKSQYVLTVSHDLQGSLATIQSCLSVVLNNLTGTIPGKAREMIARAAQRADHLIRFVKDLLNLSRIRAMETFEKQSVPLNSALQKVLAQWHMQSADKSLDIELKITKNLTILGNQEAFEEMLSNLIGNAIRYTPQYGKIRITGNRAKESGYVNLAISDTGIGIHPEDIPYIYNDFYRAKNAEILEKNGTGLGLSIVKQIIQAHGGSIWVESEPGRGSTFNMQLPQYKKNGELPNGNSKKSTDH